MGNSASAPDINAIIRNSQRAQQPAPPAPLTGPALCAVRGVELNTLHRDVQKKQEEVDTCNPVEAQERKTKTAVDENTQYVAKQRSELEGNLLQFNKQITLANQVHVAMEPLDQYLESLKQELGNLRSENDGLERSERANRRRFMDNDPQSGVGGIPAIRTSDDKVLIAFWITYGIALIAVCIVLTKMFEAQIGGTSQKMGLGALVLFVAYGIAYYCIAYYG